MGVPRLFPWLKRTFDNVVQIARGVYYRSVDNLYIDAPSLLHASAQEVNNYGQGKRLIPLYNKLSEVEKRTKTFEKFFDKIVDVTETIRPTKRLIISIDGPAPLAKQAQQGQRRFIAAKEAMSTETLVPKARRDLETLVPGFNSNQLTPGTTFMLELTKYLHTAIRKKMNTSMRGSWKHLSVYFSSPTVPGEGEHKILDFIRGLPSYISDNESHCIFGPDGDLIMLTLAAHTNNISILREDLTETSYNFVDMSIVRTELPRVIGHLGDPIDDVTNDFILLGFFVGNDFLPKIQMFAFLEDGLEHLIKRYKALPSGLTKDGEINHGVFSAFMYSLALEEEDNIFEQRHIYSDTSKGKGVSEPKRRWEGSCISEAFMDSTLLSNIKNGKLDFATYRLVYYNKAGARNQEDITRMCKDYLKSLAWVFKYYVKGLPSWKHFYPWHYAPLMADMALVMQDLERSGSYEELYTFNLSSPSLPFVQLLTVLPPSSAYLLPGPFHKLMTSPESPLVKAGYYPDPRTMHIDYEGKCARSGRDLQNIQEVKHMGIAILPFVDHEKIMEAYTPIAASLKNTYVRNSVGQMEFFAHDPNYLVRYTSDYGNIEKLSIKKIVFKA